jgi:GT2 family glycosyltransferase
VDLSIVIVNWNSKAYLEVCLKSLFTHSQGLDYEVIVIDSGSFDGCGEMLRINYPSVQFIQGDRNLGFAKANNIAFERSRGACVLFLNPDTVVLESAIARLMQVARARSDVGAVGGTLLNQDGTVQSSSIQALPTLARKALDSDFLKRRWPLWKLWGMASLYDNSVEPRPAEVISGAGLLVRRQAFESVGRFSEDYFMYAEDVDLSHKLLAAGYTNYHVPQAKIVHFGGSSSKEAANTFAAVMMPEATFRFFKKTRGAAYAWGYRALMCGCATGRLALLGVGLPIFSARGQLRVWRASSRKWVAILRWSLSSDPLVKKYYPSCPTPA